ncbi:response regulator receiver protein [Gloeothece citriformis PCC 7424]|uniref:Response regulator receiver protein n=1 Tax=Gloeothece citriformis (strain PCC 7424) TaxID=65393 RepID=B7KDA8_GLOC7|nr:DUF3685 domain-containing protein [Gloeothece citriformis]ACK68928.1 response regulator receiver protein [Gloeothece citriformis PCC 7424]
MSDRQITLIVIDDDSIFRLGLTTALSEIEDLQILDQGDTEQGFKQLREQIPDILLLDPGQKGWQLAQQIKRLYPRLKLCLVSQSLSPKALLKAKKAGIEGYYPKGKTLDELVKILRHIASGATHWQYLSTIAYFRYQKYNLGQKWYIRLGQSGINQIEESLNLVNRQLNKPELSQLDWLFWTGRRRELLVSRWIVGKLIPVETVLLPNEASSLNLSENRAVENPIVPGSPLSNLAIVSSSSALTPSHLLEETLTKIQLGLENASNIPLEIDILQPQKRQELLYLIYREIRKILTELPLLELTPIQLEERLSLIIIEIWEESTRLFIEIYYPNKERLLNGLMDEILELEKLSVQVNILDKIPFVYELFSYLLFEKTLLVDHVEYRANSPEAIARAEILLDNFIIQIANAVMAVVLNNFSENPAIKQLLYESQMISSREIAQFRNKLSWKYRQEKYWEDPKNIFESQYRLLYFKGLKIKPIIIPYSRAIELNQLSGIPWAVTLLLEFRDALAPGVRAIVAVVGQGVIYVLTSILGRGIGLIGKGILQGIGNSWQETRYKKNSQQSK